MIIDAHSHIGNILYPAGGKLIFRAGIPFPASRCLERAYEKALFRETAFLRMVNQAFPMLSVKCERRRNLAATLQNFQESLRETGIVKCVCAPVAPYNTFGDILAAQAADPRVIAFTSPDFSAVDMAEKLSEEMDAAAGLKIHPIIQEVEADSRSVMEAVEVICAYAKPVLLHAGEARYYTKRERKNCFSGYASIDKIERLISAFPGVNFIVGHAGLGEIASVLDLLPQYKNAYVDTSFQPPEAIRALISAFGGDRVLFASDWPYGLRWPAILAVREACGADAAMQRAILYENAAALLGACSV